MFAIIVGAVIIFIAIFAATSFIQSSRIESDAKVAEQLGILLNPVETSLEDSRYASIIFPVETRFINRCRDTGNFGRQIISTSLSSGFGERFVEDGTENFFFNKYIFSEEEQDVRELHLLVKPFEFPYKIADLVIGYSKDYCFVNPPGEIEEEIKQLALPKINVSQNHETCPRNSIKVCFDGDNCEITIDSTKNLVQKGEDLLYYEENLIYGAIFSSKEVYECQVIRLMKRNSELAHLYASKSDFLNARGCSTHIAEDLRQFANRLQINSSSELSQVSKDAEELRRRNENLICKAF